MKKKTYRKFAAVILAASLACVTVQGGVWASEAVQSAEEGASQEASTPEASTPETNPPETNPPETNPPETNPPETNPPETNPPETNPPETNPPETSAPETSAPETNPPETSAPEISADPGTAPAEGNHSTEIPKNPKEKKLDQEIVDAGEEDGFKVSINRGEPTVFEPGKSFRDIVTAITAGDYRYLMDYIRPGTHLREPIEIEAEGTIKAIFDKVKLMPGAACDIVLYLNDGRSLWMNMKVTGSLDTEDAEIVFTSAPEEKAFTVSYDANGGALSSSAGSVRRKGEWYSHFDVSASKDGQYFCGWFDGPGEDAVRVFPTDEVKKDVTLYAHYSPYGKTVAVFDFGFSTPGDSGSLIHHLIFPVNEDGTYTIVATPAMEHNGMVIAGWKDAYGETVEPTKLTGLTESRTFVAVWADPSEVTPGEETQEAVTEKETE